MITITANQLIVHALGDYFLQSDWMASDKTSKKIAALVHALTYTLPFLFLTCSPMALLVIAGTHFVIDQFSSHGTGLAIKLLAAIIKSEHHQTLIALTRPIFSIVLSF